MSIDWPVSAFFTAVISPHGNALTATRPRVSGTTDAAATTGLGLGATGSSRWRLKTASDPAPLTTRITTIAAIGDRFRCGGGASGTVTNGFVSTVSTSADATRVTSSVTSV